MVRLPLFGCILDVNVCFLLGPRAPTWINDAAVGRVVLWLVRLEALSCCLFEPRVLDDVKQRLLRHKLREHCRGDTSRRVGVPRARQSPQHRNLCRLQQFLVVSKRCPDGDRPKLVPQRDLIRSCHQMICQLLQATKSPCGCQFSLGEYWAAIRVLALLSSLI